MFLNEKGTEFYSEEYYKTTMINYSLSMENNLWELLYRISEDLNESDKANEENFENIENLFENLYKKNEGNPTQYFLNVVEMNSYEKAKYDLLQKGMKFKENYNILKKIRLIFILMCKYFIIFLKTLICFIKISIKNTWLKLNKF